jgi:hypothetical protein
MPCSWCAGCMAGALLRLFLTAIHTAVCLYLSGLSDTGWCAAEVSVGLQLKQ